MGGAAADLAPVLFMLYALSAFVATVVALAMPFPLPRPSPEHAEHGRGSSQRFYSYFRAAATVGLVWLAFGTGCDNARTFAGLHASGVPDGVFNLRNTTQANELLSPGDFEDANYRISWFCFFAHECLGGIFLLPGMYLWVVASSLPQTYEGCCADAGCATLMQVYFNKKHGLRPRQATDRTNAIIACVLSAVGCVVGLVGFVHYTATQHLQLQWNPTVEVWKWGAAEAAHNPQGLFGVFLSSGVWIAVGVLLWQWLGIRWFALMQLVSFAGQGGSAALGDAIELSSNFFEQAVTWALIVLGWQLRKMVQHRQRPTTEEQLLEGGPINFA